MSDYSLLWYLCDQLKRFFYALVRNLFARLEFGGICVTVETENIVRVFRADGDKFASS